MSAFWTACARRLFELAELHCRQRLERPDLNDAQRLDLVLQLSQTLAAHAVESPAGQREPLWKQARESIDAFDKQHPHHPRRLALGLQHALVDSTIGELSRQEADVTGRAGPEVEVARQALRDAIGQLRQLDEQAGVELRNLAAAQRAEPGRWTSAELISLQTTIRYQLARACAIKRCAMRPTVPIG